MTVREDSRWMRVAIAAILVLTGWRIWGLWVAPTDLFVDEAQYWLWARTPDFGYFSKPPLIAWVIGAATAMGGSDTPFWVRLPAPLFHAATALILMALARARFGAAVAGWTGLVYATMPGVSLGSAVISTDTVLFPFFALALLGWWRLLAGAGAATALLTGLALGIAFLGKYAALYFWFGVALGALVPRRRAWPGWRRTGQVLAGFALAASPNLLWNAQHGGRTLHHTLDNADWVRDPGARAGLNPDHLMEFLAAQFGVFGPLLFAALIWAAWRAARGRAARDVVLLLLFALPVIALIAGQALISRAYANWAAVAYLPASVAVAALSWARARWLLWASLAINGAVAVALPVALSQADTLRAGDRLAFARLTGRAEASLALIAVARAGGATTIVAENRDLLADLYHTGRDSGLAIRALRRPGPPANHYAAAHPWTGGTGTVLWVRGGTEPPTCPAEQAMVLAPETGAYAGRTFTAWTVDAACPAMRPGGG